MRARSALKCEINEEKNLPDEKQCHGADEHKRPAGPPRLHSPVDRVGEMRITAGNLTTPNFILLQEGGNLMMLSPCESAPKVP